MVVSTDAAAIQHHYDLGNDFYQLWLDRSLTYSCAMPDGPECSLETAQERKLRYHLDMIGASATHTVLDIGCGWGSTLRRFSELGPETRSVGLTLSKKQATYISAQNLPGVEVRLESWTDYEADRKFDGIISIGAFEHFAAPEDSTSEKIERYRHFLSRCRDWLVDGGVLSLQSVAYANMRREDASRFMQQEIFPHADLPTLAEIAAAAEGMFEVRTIRNDRLDYAWTCEQWAQRLRRRREQAVDLVGAEAVARYERYLKMSALGFRMGKLCLLRLALTPYSPRYFGGGR